MNSILFFGELVWLSVFFKIDTWWCGWISLLRFIDENCSMESCFIMYPLRWSANEMTESCLTNWARCMSKWLEKKNYEHWKWHEIIIIQPNIMQCTIAYLMVFDLRMIRSSLVSLVDGVCGKCYHCPGCTMNSFCFQCMKFVCPVCLEYLCVVQYTIWCYLVYIIDHVLINRNLVAKGILCVGQCMKFVNLVLIVNAEIRCSLVSIAFGVKHCCLAWRCYWNFLVWEAFVVNYGCLV